ncbi:MAG: hypothetical protein V3R93_02820 [Candidatus Hydrothermarchaeaceae archaeon]
MAPKQNCWEFKECGREPEGAKVAELGVCPATIDTFANGLNGGKNAGRLCWATAGTHCGGKAQGTIAQKLANCTACDIYKTVEGEESDQFILLNPDQTPQESKK